MARDILKIHRYIKKTQAEGPGKRMAIWLQGCSIHCEGCFEKQTWDPNKGYEFSCDQLVKILSSIPDISGVTILGGEPMEQAEALSRFLGEVKKLGLNTIVFSGYEYEILLEQKNFWINQVLSSADLLIDGKFDFSQPETVRPLVGSSNQRFIFLSDVFSHGSENIAFYSNKVEVRISKDGVVSVNGMWHL